MIPSIRRRRLVGGLLCAAGVSARVRPAFGQVETFPDRTVKLVVPFTAGGSNDVVGRAVARELSVLWKQPVIVDNRPGAGGNLGAANVARAPADGYTLLVVANNFVINPTLYADGSAGYDPVKGFTPISLLARVPILLLVNPQLPVRTVSDLIALAKAKPSELAYASAGIGTPHHLSAELFKSMAGIQMTHVPYRGAVPAATDLIGGRVQVLFGVANSVMPLVKKGLIRPLAICGDARLPDLPQIPRVAETRGMERFQSEVWIGLVGPARLADARRDALNRDVVRTLADSSVRQTLASQDLRAESSSPDKLATVMATDMARWAQVIRETGARAE